MRHSPTIRALAILGALSLVACSDDPAPADADADADADTDLDADLDADAGLDADLDADADEDAPPDPAWEAFVAAREGYLRALAVPVAECIVSEDTSNPAFHGCYDWHSAVHATWALLAIGRVLGDDEAAALANAQLGADAVAGELAQLEAGELAAAELPYGYAWLLTLAVERERGGATDLVPLAEVAAEALEAYVGGLTSDQIDRALGAADYDNLSWALFNLLAWARQRGDVERAAWVEAFVVDEVLPREDVCPLSGAGEETGNFFSPALQRATVLFAALPEPELEAWIAANVPALFDLEPLEAPMGVHPAGLNFSRTWGLHALFEATGERRFRGLYLHHVEAHMALPAYWAENYDFYSHWVPQFGIYGILLGFDEP